MSIQTRKRRIDFLRHLREQTVLGGPILISFFARSDAAEYYISAFIANILRRGLRREPAEVGDWLGPFYVHHFVKQEINSELAEGGFEPVYYGTTDYGHAVGRAARHDMDAS